MSDNKAFRDYATRVSFNMTLSRNQIYVLRLIIAEIQHETSSYDDRLKVTGAIRDENRAFSGSDHFVPGIRALISMGLVMNDPRYEADMNRIEIAQKAGKREVRKYYGPAWKLTDAGEHVVELLRIAGLVPAAIANQNRKRKVA